jgi:hypothetical protein
MLHREIEISNSDDVIDVRDVIAKIEEMEEREGGAEDHEMCIELRRLRSLMEDLKGYGGDEQWRGDWYPLQLIHDSYFETHAQELAEDCGMIERDAKWPYTCIDWKQAARELRGDYSSVEFEGVTYWYR